MLTVRVERMYSGVVSLALGVPPLFRSCTPLCLLSCLPGDTGREHGQPISVQKSVSVYQLSLETLLVSVEQVMLTVKTAPLDCPVQCLPAAFLLAFFKFQVFIGKFSLWMIASILGDLVLYILLGSKK